MLRCLKFILDSTTRGCDILALLTETKDTFPDANFDILQELVNVGRELQFVKKWHSFCTAWVHQRAHCFGQAVILQLPAISINVFVAYALYELHFQILVDRSMNDPSVLKSKCLKSSAFSGTISRTMF